LQSMRDLCLARFIQTHTNYLSSRPKSAFMHRHYKIRRIGKHILAVALTHAAARRPKMLHCQSPYGQNPCAQQVAHCCTPTQQRSRLVMYRPKQAVAAHQQTLRCWQLQGWSMANALRAK